MTIIFISVFFFFLGDISFYSYAINPRSSKYKVNHACTQTHWALQVKVPCPAVVVNCGRLAVNLRMRILKQ